MTDGRVAAACAPHPAPRRAVGPATSAMTGRRAGLKLAARFVYNLRLATVGSLPGSGGKYFSCRLPAAIPTGTVDRTGATATGNADRSGQPSWRSADRKIGV